METIFSTDAVKIRDRFRIWQEVSRARMPPFEMCRIGDMPFEAHLEAAQVGHLKFNRTTFGGHRIDADRSAVRRYAMQGSLIVAFRSAGQARCAQYDRAAVEQPGDLTVYDPNAPFRQEFGDAVRSLRIEVPRKRLEHMLGPARLFAAMPADAALPATALARTFLTELVRVHEGMSPETAARTASIGTDLIVASLAERMAQDTPRSIQGTVTVQRAKAYIESNLGDPNLAPPTLAAAVGVSLRRLQELFQERGRHISDWIWERRLEVAAERLLDPGHTHLQIGALAYSCGFANQTHFAKRFRARFGFTPSEYRRAAIEATRD